MATSHASKAGTARERVLKAATALFAAKGFHETSTRDIARRARVNEITIYRLFKNKREMYFQVLDNKMALIRTEWLRPILQSSEDSKKVFLALAERLEALFDPTFLRLVFYAALEKPGLFRRCYQPRLVNLYEILGEYIRERIDEGVLRNIDPTLMARSLVAMIAYHQIVSQLLGGSDLPGSNIAGPAKAYTDIWLHGAFTTRGYASPPARVEGARAAKEIDSHFLAD